MDSVLKGKIGKRSIEIYIDPAHPASFSHPEKVHQYLRKEKGFKNVNLKQVKQALYSLNSYSQHKRLINKYSRMITRSDDADERWQIDLMKIENLTSNIDKPFKYLLLIIDVFTRFLFAVPLYDKSRKEVTEGLELIFLTTGKIPYSITSDAGLEFNNDNVRSLCKKYKINQFFSVPKITHASIVERVILSLRIKIGKMMTQLKNENIMNIIEYAVNSYNNSIHSSLGMTPAEANFGTGANRQLAQFTSMQRNTSKKERNGANQEISSLREGDDVRLPQFMAYREKQFKKAHVPTFGEDVYKIAKVFISDKRKLVYRLKLGENQTERSVPFAIRRLKSDYYSPELSSAGNKI